MKRRLKMALISLSPLVLFINLVPGIQVVDIRLLLTVQLAVLGFLSWRYREELVEWNLRKITENRESFKRGHLFRIHLVTILLVGLSIFFLVHYLSELLKE